MGLPNNSSAKAFISDLYKKVHPNTDNSTSSKSAPSGPSKRYDLLLDSRDEKATDRSRNSSETTSRSNSENKDSGSRKYRTVESRRRKRHDISESESESDEA